MYLFTFTLAPIHFIKRWACSIYIASLDKTGTIAIQECKLKTLYVEAINLFTPSLSGYFEFLLFGRKA
jgi:hypothetical protein